MFVVNTAITFSFTRAINATPQAITLVRVYKPGGDIDDLVIGTNTLPTATATGLLTFTYTPTLAGNHAIEILRSTTPYILVSRRIIVVVSEDTTFTTMLFA